MSKQQWRLPDACEQRLTAAFRTCLARQPSSSELQTLANLLQAARDRHSKDKKGAAALLKGNAMPERVEPTELAAWYEVATVLLNLDETITKG
jgi:hypothetical protein